MNFLFLVYIAKNLPKPNKKRKENNGISGVNNPNGIQIK